jgi:hypothetical protein
MTVTPILRVNALRSIAFPSYPAAGIRPKSGA